MYELILLMFCGIVASASICDPDISEGIYSNLTVNGQTSLECNLYNCKDAQKVVFEKTHYLNSTEWTPVFEEINSTHYQTIDIGDNLYSLNQRNEYKAFRKQRILYISPLKLKDQGDWRCVVYDQNSKSTVSEGVQLFFAKTCDLNISEGMYSNLTFDGQTSLECDLSNCHGVGKVVFEKTHFFNSKYWTPVFEEINTTVYMSIDSGDNLYSLNQRNEYKAFRKQRILYISPLIETDQGYWRCVAYDNNKRRTESPTVHLLFPSIHKLNVTAQKENSKKYKTSVLSNTFSSITTFTCPFEGITTDPDANRPLYGTKEQACVSFQQEMNFTTNSNSSFTLNCRGIGHGPHISWARNGVNILDEDTGYVIHRSCNSSMCTGSITSKPIALDSGCPDTSDYSGVYTCHISPEFPYRSTHGSHRMIVYVHVPRSNASAGVCNRNDFGVGIWVILAIGVVAVSIVSIQLYYQAKHCEHDSMNIGFIYPSISKYFADAYGLLPGNIIGPSFDSLPLSISEDSARKEDLSTTVSLTTIKLKDIEQLKDSGFSEGSESQSSIEPLTVSEYGSGCLASNVQQSSLTDKVTRAEDDDVQDCETKMEISNIKDMGCKINSVVPSESFATPQTVIEHSCQSYDSGYSASSGINTRSRKLDEPNIRGVQYCETEEVQSRMLNLGIPNVNAASGDSEIQTNNIKYGNVDTKKDSQPDTNQKWTTLTEETANIHKAINQMSKQIDSATDGSNTITKIDFDLVHQFLTECDSRLRNMQLSINSVERQQTGYTENPKSGSCISTQTEPIKTDQEVEDFIFEDHLGILGDNLTIEKWKNRYEELKDKKTQEKAIEILSKLKFNEKRTFVNGFELKSNELKPGDRIKVNDADTFEQLQQGHGGYEPAMTSILNETGVVDRKILHVFSVTFESGKRYLLNEQNLTRISKDDYINRFATNASTKYEPLVSLQEGDLVQLLRDAESVRTSLNRIKRVGWHDEMKKCLGSPGIVLGVRENGSATVRFSNGKMWVMSPDVLKKQDLKDEILEKGDLVMVTMKKKDLETFQREIGEWHKNTCKKSGMFGILRSMEEKENRLQVEIGGTDFIFHKQAVRLVAKQSELHTSTQ